MTPYDRHLQAASGFIELGMPLDAHEELEQIEPEIQTLSEVLAVRALVYQALGRWEPMEAVCRQLCRLRSDEPQWLIMLAHATLHPETCSAGRRLIGIDGTQFSCGNTQRILGTMTKAATRRLTTALAKLGCAVLVEPGTHASLAAALSAPDLAESESALARELLGHLPGESMLLGDRLFGNGVFSGRLLSIAPAGKEQAFLSRVGKSPKPRVIERLSAGSTLVEVAWGSEEAQALGSETVRVREVRGRVRRPGGAWSEVRLRTRRGLRLWNGSHSTPGAGRSCGRGVRPPVKSWPRVHQPQ